MKRYTIKTEARVTEDMHSMRVSREALSIVAESESGEWVRWSDVEKLREYLEGQIPEKRIEKLERMIGLVREGKCPECLQQTRGYISPSGLFAPEAYATLKEMGIDPTTGHRFGCSLANALDDLHPPRGKQ